MNRSPTALNFRAVAERLLRTVSGHVDDIDAWMQAAGLPPGSEPMSGKQLVRLLSLAKNFLGDEFYGHTSNKCRLGTLPLMLEMGLHCETLAAFIDQSFRFYSVVTEDLRFECSIDHEDAVVSIHLARPELDKEYFLDDYWLVHWHLILSWVVNHLIPVKRVNFRSPEKANHERLAFCIRGNWLPGQETTGFVFSEKYLSLPIVRTRDDLVELLSAGRDGMINWPDAGLQWGARVKSLLMTAMAEGHSWPSVTDVAESLCVSPPTLRRRLREEGTGYIELSDQVRHAAAVELLHVQRLNVAEVAERLGFAEPRSFSRAFKQWTGASPGAYAQRLLKTRLPN